MIKVYDFDKTLTYKDTSLMFLFYACNFLKMKTIKRGMIIFYAICHKIRLISNDQFKSLAFMLVFKGKNRQAIADISRMFFTEKSDILNVLGKQVITRTEHQYVLTASPACYVSLYLKNVTVIGTTFSFDLDNIFSGINSNCYGARKVLALRTAGVLKVDEFYTDSFSDKPMMMISKRNFLVKGDLIQELQSFITKI